MSCAEISAHILEHRLQQFLLKSSTQAGKNPTPVHGIACTSLCHSNITYSLVCAQQHRHQLEYLKAVLLNVLLSSAVATMSAAIVQVVNETLPALVKLRDQGLVRFIGITGLPLKIFPYILDR